MNEVTVETQTTNSQKTHQEIEAALKQAQVTLVDAGAGVVECDQCGRTWIALLQRGGTYHADFLKCPEGCNKDAA